MCVIAFLGFDLPCCISAVSPVLTLFSSASSALLHAVYVMTSILRAGEERRFIDLSTTCDRPAALSPDEARASLV
jgi:hypothetical protein